MTCIAGLVKDGVVYIGGDSAGCAGHSLSVRADEKVFVNGDFLIGFTSSFRMGQLLRYAFHPPAHPFVSSGEKLDTYQYMVINFVDAVRECLKDGGFAETHSDAERGGMFLVGYQGRLFVIDSDYQVGETYDGYAAVGCGSDIALGALYATTDYDPYGRIETALEAAERHSTGVRAPFVIMSTSE